MRLVPITQHLNLTKASQDGDHTALSSLFLCLTVPTVKELFCRLFLISPRCTIVKIFRSAGRLLSGPL